MYNRLGVYHTTYTAKAHTGKDGVFRKEAYYIRVSEKGAIDIFSKILGEDTIQKNLKISRKTHIDTNSGTLLSIKRIEAGEYNGDVINFEVEKNHTYVVEDFVVHNCLPKDTAALNYLAKSLGTNVEFFDNILTENAKYKTTVFEGMRKE